MWMPISFQKDTTLKSDVPPSHTSLSTALSTIPSPQPKRFYLRIAFNYCVQLNGLRMGLIPKHSRLHAALSCALYDQRFRGRFVTLETATSILNSFAPDGCIATQNTLFTAFKGAKGENYDTDLGLKGDLACPPGTIMAVRSIRYRTTNLFTVVGCFSSLAEVPMEKEIRELATSDSVERISARGDRGFFIPPRILGHFLDYAKEWFKIEQEAAAAVQPKRKKGRPNTPQTSTGRGPGRGRGKRNRPQTPNTRPSTPNLVLQTPCPLLSAKPPAVEIQELKSLLGQQLKQRRELEASIVAKINRLKELGSKAKKRKTMELHYILGGKKAGKIDVEIGRGVVLYSDLLGGILSEEATPSTTINPPPDNNSNQSTIQTSAPPPSADLPTAPSLNQHTAPSANLPTPSPSTNPTAATSTNPSIPSSENEPSAPSTNPSTKTNANPPATSQKKREFVLDKKNNIWVPKRHLLVDKTQYTKDMTLANGAKKVIRLFKGKQTSFSAKAKQTIIASTIPAAGASDAGVQSVIFGTLKAIVDEMGLKVSPRQLARGCPSVKSLRNWEFKLAAGCLAKVIHQIACDAERMMKKYGKKLQITLVTDHGNRQGVDHFVKMICWTSIDRRGKHVLRHFNLDVDRGGHTTSAAVEAIKKSLDSLHLDDLDVEYSFICGDSGGGAKVQALFVLLKELGILCPDSDFMNCILHAFNLSYQSACNDALGDAGMNNDTCFQMCFLAILMVKTVKKQTSLETLKSYYRMTMEQLLENDSYQNAAKANFVEALEDLMEHVERSGDDITSDEMAEDMNLEALLNGCPTNLKEPNFGRWGTVSDVAKVVLKHWLPSFYIWRRTSAKWRRPTSIYPQDCF
jgi:hypothetical protein